MASSKFKPGQKVLMLKHGNWPADAAATIMSVEITEEGKNTYWIAFDTPQTMDCGNGKIAYNTMCIDEEHLTPDLSGTSSVIDYEIAWRLRNDRGITLPPDRNYIDTRLKNIATRQNILMKELALLDEEIYQKATEQKAKRTDNEIA